MGNKILNICLHNIVDRDSDVKTIYELTISQLIRLENSLETLREKNVFSSYELFFDDGYKSFISLARNHDFKINKNFIHAAVITERIGQEGYMSQEDVIWIHNAGFSVCSHGVSHAALAVFNGTTVSRTPSGSIYQNKPYGKDHVLSYEEVKYQLIESSKYLESLIGVRPSYFVLPYGLYNDQSIYLAAVESSYSRLYSCDKAFDTGQFLSPRLLVTQENIENIEDEIMGLADNFTPLV